MSKRSKQGYAIMAILLGAVVVGTIGISTLMIHRAATVERTHAIRKNSARALSNAGMQWAMKHFGEDDNWYDKAGLINGSVIDMKPGYFEIGIPAVISTSVTIAVTGNVKFKNAVIASTMQMTLYKKRVVGGDQIDVGVTGNFALFLANPLLLQLDNTQIKGNVYNGANGDVDGPSSVTNGKFYVPHTYTVSGAGVYEAENVDAAPQWVPFIDVSYYNEMMTSLNSYFTGRDNVSLTGTVNLSAAPYYGELRCKKLTFSDPCVIIGEGIIAAKNTIIADHERLTIKPDCGKLIILAAKKEVKLAAPTEADKIDIERAIIYSKQDGYIQVRYPYTTIRDSVLLCAEDSRLDLWDGAKIIDSLFVGNAELSHSTVFNMQCGSQYPSTYFSGVAIAQIGTGRLYGTEFNRAKFDGMYYANGNHQHCLLMNKTDVVGMVIGNRAWGDENRGSIIDSTISYNGVTLPNNITGNCEEWVANILPYSWSGN
ncbi:hypothetical protein ACFL57_00300 [Candidatus Margulisiibacteriota bacterium]